MSTTDEKFIAVIVGSLRRGSYAKLIARNAMGMFPEGFVPAHVAIGHLPLYNFDYDDPKVTDVETPAEYTAFRERIKSAAGILFVTPENNRTIPAALKNAIDIGSKPNSDVAWKNKPVGIISHSVGRMGGYSSQKNLRLALSYFDVTIPGQPEVFLGNSPTLLDDNGCFNNDSTREFVQGYIDRFCEIVNQFND